MKANLSKTEFAEALLQQEVSNIIDFFESYSTKLPNANEMLAAAIDSIRWMFDESGTLNGTRYMTFSKCVRMLETAPYTFRCSMLGGGRFATDAAKSALKEEMGERWAELNDIFYRPVGGYRENPQKTSATAQAVMA